MIPEINTALLLALMPAILGLVNFVKALGLEGRALTVASMLIGVLLAVAAQLLPEGIFQVAFNGLIIGLAASGLYDVAAMFAKRPSASAPAAEATLAPKQPSLFQ